MIFPLPYNRSAVREPHRTTERPTLAMSACEKLPAIPGAHKTEYCFLFQRRGVSHAAASHQFIDRDKTDAVVFDADVLPADGYVIGYISLHTIKRHGIGIFVVQNI